ncbi:MAG: prepilin-type N-terminal cleavage/methylation domain-containing protein [Erysipelotrichales bacterium]|nr:prepilin-type N-terminal cleavage/methylation domain-containing protein [Erysipelotrichales bacterium]
MRIKGFTVTEMIAVMMIVSVLMLLNIYRIPAYTDTRQLPKLVGSELMKIQSESIRFGKPMDLEFGEDGVNGIRLPARIDGKNIHVSEFGMIDHPQTVKITGRKNQISFPVWLGTGRAGIYEN